MTIIDTPPVVLPRGDLFGEVEINGALQRNKIGRWELTNLITSQLDDVRDTTYDNSYWFSLDAAFKARWLIDLRSGAYEQAQSVLCDLQNKRCCLGVAFSSIVAVRDDLRLQIHDAQTFKKLELYKKTNRISDAGEPVWRGSEPSDRVASHTLIGLTGIEGTLGQLNHCVKITYTSGIQEELKYEDNLATLNDDGLTFLDIADIIEADLPARAA